MVCCGSPSALFWKIRTQATPLKENIHAMNGGSAATANAYTLPDSKTIGPLSLKAPKHGIVLAVSNIFLNASECLQRGSSKRLVASIPSKPDTKSEDSSMGPLAFPLEMPPVKTWRKTGVESKEVVHYCWPIFENAWGQGSKTSSTYSLNDLIGGEQEMNRQHNSETPAQNAPCTKSREL